MISGKDQIRYEATRKAVDFSFPRLSSRVIEQLANAGFLLSSHTDDLPIYAGAIIEYSKALEKAVNERPSLCADQLTISINSSQPTKTVGLLERIQFPSQPPDVESADVHFSADAWRNSLSDKATEVIECYDAQVDNRHERQRDMPIPLHPADFCFFYSGIATKEESGCPF
jgi:hypothetical protein